MPATPIDMPSTPRHANNVTVPAVPTPAGPYCMQTRPVVSRANDRDMKTQLPTEVLAMGSRMQQLADVNTGSETADALMSRSDELSQSENRGRRAWTAGGSCGTWNCAARRYEPAGGGSAKLAAVGRPCWAADGAALIEQAHHDMLHGDSEMAADAGSVSLRSI